MTTEERILNLFEAEQYVKPLDIPRKLNMAHTPALAAVKRLLHQDKIERVYHMGKICYQLVK
mgnify:CR=1 FL=1